MIRWTRRLLAPLALLVVAPAARASAFEYLYVEANAGGSAGGHFALRLGDWVYDFQNAELGTLRLRRTEFDLFRYLYTVLENRTLHIARIHVPRETHEVISDRFNRRYLNQNRQFSTLDALRGDRELIRLLLARAGEPTTDTDDRAISPIRRRADSRRGRAGSRLDRAPPPEAQRAISDGNERAGPRESESTAHPDGEWNGVPIRGAGFFYDGRSEDARDASPSLRGLRERVASIHGPDYLADRIAALERVAEDLSPTIELTAAKAQQPRARPEFRYGFSDRYRDLGAQIAALRVLANATRLQPSARRIPSGADYALDRAERRAIRAFAERLEADLVQLASSRRPDWGYPLLLGMARLETLRESLERGRWVVLDSVPENPELLSRRAVARRDPFVVELRDRARAQFLEARTHFATAREPGEPALAWLEEAVNRHAEFQRGFERNRAIPLYEAGILPDRSAAVRELPLPAVDRETLRRAAAAAAARERSYVAEVKRDFGYRLVSNNCVTEIFAMVGAGSEPTGLREEAEERGHPDELFDFIPAVAYRSVLAAHPDAEPSEIPSFRRIRLEAMYETENDLRVYLRESNTLTSTIYRRNDVEPFFLFFTEDALPLRPVYGAFNFAAGIGEAALGVLRAPWDRGRTLVSGLEGAAFSLPELFFVNLRKGILEYAPGETPRTQRRPAPTRPDERKITHTGVVWSTVDGADHRDRIDAPFAARGAPRSAAERCSARRSPRTRCPRTSRR